MQNKNKILVPTLFVLIMILLTVAASFLII